ncbi:hypothetical protein LCGC14_1401150, partial [marine sediment metagenome]
LSGVNKMLILMRGKENGKEEKR